MIWTLRQLHFELLNFILCLAHAMHSATLPILCVALTMCLSVAHYPSLRNKAGTFFNCLIRLTCLRMQHFPFESHAVHMSILFSLSASLFEWNHVTVSEIWMRDERNPYGFRGSSNTFFVHTSAEYFVYLWQKFNGENRRCRLDVEWYAKLLFFCCSLLPLMFQPIFYGIFPLLKKIPLVFNSSMIVLILVFLCNYRFLSCHQTF